MKKYILLPVFLTSILLFVTVNIVAQGKTAVILKSKAPATIEIIQFHSEHRCVTCIKIEELTLETLKSFPNVPFLLVNVDDKKNEKIATQFEAAGTALFLYNPKSKNKQDISDMAFMNAGDKTKFMKELIKKIEAFQ
jgi:thiol-disulfide isomerase/thioredoxin